MTYGKNISRRESLRILGGAVLLAGLDNKSILKGATDNLPDVLNHHDLAVSILKPALFESSPLAPAIDSPEIACVGRPSLTEGPFFVDEKLNRSDIRPDPSNGTVKAGTKVTIRFNIYRTTGTTCTPLSGAYVDIWHCDASGGYSDVSGQGNPNNLGLKFLRGYQVTDANGTVQFTTIYPGWYSGRTVHIHYKVRLYAGSNKTYEFTSQLMFDDTLTDQVFQQSPYNTRGTRDTRNSNDNIYQSGGSTLLLSLTSDGAGGYMTSYEVSLSGLPATTSSVAAVSAASYLSGGSVSPNGIAALFGNGLASGISQAQSLPLPTALGDTTVTIKDSTGSTVTAQLFYVSPGQINLLVPDGLATGTATFTVYQLGVAVASGTVTLATVSPGIFSANANGAGVAAGYIQRVKAGGGQTIESILTYDQTSGSFLANGVTIGPDDVFLILFGTGIRQRSSLAGISCDLGGIAASVQYAGPQGYFAGVDQVNLQLPATLTGKGEVPVNLRVDGISANAVTVKFS